MLKKTIAVLAVAGALVVLGGGAAAARTYPIDIACVAGTAVLSPGESTDIECRGETVPAGATAVFTVSGPGVGEVALASTATVGTTQVTKTASGDGVLTVRFTAPDVTESSTYAISVSDTAGTFAAATTVTVEGTEGAGAGDGAGTGADGVLSTSDGEGPAALLWVGLGALGVGAIVVIAVLMRRRSRSTDSES